MSKIWIITGKGGVGKSSVAAAHAVKSAAQGVKTLLVSTDMAHNIADIFQCPIGGHITKIADCLYGLELDPDLMMREEFPDMNQSIANMFSKGGLKAEQIGTDYIFPGFDDLFSLLKIVKIQESGEFERIIVDCAPTGETLSLLKLPELLAWYMEKFFPVGKTMVRVLAPISKYRYHVTLPSSEAMDEIGKFHQKMIHLQEVLKDEKICSVRLVCTPEKMVVEETKRNYMYLNLYGYQVDGVFINRILPADMDNAFFEKWNQIQKTYLEEIEAVFGGLSLVKVPWFPEEIRGMEAVQNMVSRVFDQEGSDDFFRISLKREKETYLETECGYLLTFPLPLGSMEELTVTCHDQDLDICLHNFQRRIPLPDVLRTYEMHSVKMEDGFVKIEFRSES